MGIEAAGMGQVVPEGGNGGCGREAFREADGRVGKGWNSDGGHGGTSGARETLGPGSGGRASGGDTAPPRARRWALQELDAAE